MELEFSLVVKLLAMASALWCIFALAVMVAYCSAQTCRSLIGSSCTGDQYTCMSQEVTCQSTWNDTCYSRSDLASALGKSFEQKKKKGCQTVNDAAQLTGVRATCQFALLFVNGDRLFLPGIV